MSIVNLLEQRRKGWLELENLCSQLELRRKSKIPSGDIVQFAALYRSACADLALAQAYQLPPTTVEYLHRLVARAHNQLYRARRSSLQSMYETVLHKAPVQIYRDPCVRICALMFFGLFWLSMILAMSENQFPNYPAAIAGEETLEMTEENFEQELDADVDHYVMMSSFYIRHNTGIGLKCFAYGILIIPCLLELLFNAVVLGAVFGYMARDSSSGGENFFEFVTAHGPFELTAIVLAAAAGLRLGMGLISTSGLTRRDSLMENALAAVPIIAASAVLFFLAAMTEGFLSPSAVPYTIKAMWAIASSALLTFYFVILGFPRDGQHGT